MPFRWLLITSNQFVVVDKRWQRTFTYCVLSFLVCRSLRRPLLITKQTSAPFWICVKFTLFHQFNQKIVLLTIRRRPATTNWLLLPLCHVLVTVILAGWTTNERPSPERSLLVHFLTPDESPPPFFHTPNLQHALRCAAVRHVTTWNNCQQIHLCHCIGIKFEIRKLKEILWLERFILTWLLNLQFHFRWTPDSSHRAQRQNILIWDFSTFLLFKLWCNVQLIN